MTVSRHDDSRSFSSCFHKMRLIVKGVISSESKEGGSEGRSEEGEKERKCAFTIGVNMRHYEKLHALTATAHG